MDLESLFFEQHPNPMIIFNFENLQILRVNKSAVRKYGYSRDEFIRLTIEDIRPPEDISELHNVLEDNPSGVSEQGTHRHQTKSGEIIHVKITAQNYNYADQKCRIVHVHDITKTIVLKNKYRDTLAELYHHIEENPLAMIKFDQDLRITEWSKRSVQKFGYSTEDALGCTALELGLFPKGEHTSIENNINKLANGTFGSIRFSAIAIKKNSDSIYVNIHATALRNVDEDLKSIVAFIEDVTSQRRTELLFNTMEKMAKIGGWEYNLQTDELFWTDQIYDIYEIPKSEKVNTDQALSFYIPEDRKQLQSELENVIKNRASYDSEYRIETASGKKKWVRTIGRPINRNGKLIKVAGTLQDITKQKLRQIEINKNAKEKEVLLAEIHHRVKNNLAIISGLLELKAMNLEDGKTKDILRQSQLRIKSMAMIHEALYEANDFSNLEFAQFVDNLIDAIDNAHGYLGKNITIDYHCDKLLELNVNQAIPCGLLINELVTNALKHAFIERDEGVINVSITFNKSNNQVKVQVVDNGNGLPQEFIDGETNSLGATLIEQLTAQLSGDMRIENKNGAFIEIQFERSGKGGSSSQNFKFS